MEQKLLMKLFPMAADRITYLIQKCINNEATPEERAELVKFAGATAYRDIFFKAMESAWNDGLSKKIVRDADREKLIDLILAEDSLSDGSNEPDIQTKKPSVPAVGLSIPLFKRAWVRYAAAMLLVFGTAAYLFLFTNKKNGFKITQSQVENEDFSPGREGAILKLADGRELVLDSLNTGVVAMQEGTQIVLNNGELRYTSPGPETAKPLYNSLITPRGRQFQLVLPDGTRAWMNAGSVLRYPTAFSGNERRVEVSGEVFFDVAHDVQKPFLIDVNDQVQIRVLGTSFNVNAYTDESAIKTTLVNGSLKVIGKDSVVLAPGQQAVVSNVDASIRKFDNADMDKALAWQRGLFNFEGMPLEEAMRQIERWYDIEVEYEKNVPDIRFGGKMSNDVSLAGLLKSLQESELKFRMEGRKLIVLP